MRIENVSFGSSAPDELSGEDWSFFLLDGQLVVDTYEVWSKASKRHKAQVHTSWSRLNRRDSRLKQSDVPLTPEVAARAKKEWIEKLEANVTVGFQELRHL